jgi:hypothetical protein
VPRPKQKVLLDQDIKEVLRDVGVTPTDPLPVSTAVTEDIPELKPRVIPPRKTHGELQPAPRPIHQPKKVVRPPTVAELLAKMDPPFDPLVELVNLYRNGHETVLDKEGCAHEIPIKAETRASILKELLAHVHVKAKPVEQRAEDQGPPVVNIISYGSITLNGDNNPPRLGTSELPAPSVAVLREEPTEGSGSLPVAPTGG